LFLPWSEDRFAERIEQTIDMFVREGLLLNVTDDDGGILTRNTGQTDEVFRLRAIGHSLQQAFAHEHVDGLLDTLGKAVLAPRQEQ
ncbi:hypothetical protein, partial [Xanthomonas arboricola]|uniref:hypothetical protein n=1 Tax=Xanthomonas arboricola TaxID=56448 RepID=UPI002157CDB3